MMTEKQRWLMKDLETWMESELAKVGRYGPIKPLAEPARVVAARRAAKRASAILQQWEKAKNAPWEKQRKAIYARREEVKRVILFEKTEAALKAIRALR